LIFYIGVFTMDGLLVELCRDGLTSRLSRRAAVLLRGFFLDFRCVITFASSGGGQKLVCVGFPVCVAVRTREWIGVLPYGKGGLVARITAITLSEEASSELFMQVAAAVL
jgi:hypothetical protein